MKMLELILLIFAVAFYAGAAHPRVTSTWNLAALGSLCVTVVLALLFVIPAF